MNGILISSLASTHVSNAVHSAKEFAFQTNVLSFVELTIVLLNSECKLC